MGGELGGSWWLWEWLSHAKGTWLSTIITALLGLSQQRIGSIWVLLAMNKQFACFLRRKLGGITKKPLETIFGIECILARKWARSAHKRLMIAQWALGDNPEWFDHDIDLYYQWIATGNSLWLERGVFSSLCIKPGASVLELCCGDGFNASNFYANKCKQIIACDFDKSAIKHARKAYKRNNLKFVEADIRTNMPNGNFDNIIWDAAIEHFTESEIDKLISDIKQRMKQGAIISGYTIVENDAGVKHLHQHEYEFKSKQDLLRFFEPHFKYITVFETIFPSRHNLYFWASDDNSQIPFSEQWSSSIRENESSKAGYN